jgi:exodeoxyribonuclease-3
VATWDLTSLGARLEAVGRVLERAAPDVVCLQETRSAQLSERAVSTFERTATPSHTSAGRAYNGVAVAARHPIADVRASGDVDAEHLDREPRIISCLVATPAPLRSAPAAGRLACRYAT